VAYSGLEDSESHFLISHFTHHDMVHELALRKSQAQLLLLLQMEMEGFELCNLCLCRFQIVTTIGLLDLEFGPFPYVVDLG
ncbi:Hypothetical predicted protein, partial [Olea europaea subsp. europaea]